MNSRETPALSIVTRRITPPEEPSRAMAWAMAVVLCRVVGEAVVAAGARESTIDQAWTIMASTHISITGELTDPS